MGLMRNMRSLYKEDVWGEGLFPGVDLPGAGVLMARDYVLVLGGGIKLAMYESGWARQTADLRRDGTAGWFFLRWSIMYLSA